jgi:hypothetical protein
MTGSILAAQIVVRAHSRGDKEQTDKTWYHIALFYKS